MSYNCICITYNENISQDVTFPETSVTYAADVLRRSWRQHGIRLLGSRALKQIAKRKQENVKDAPGKSIRLYAGNISCNYFVIWSRWCS